MKFYYLFFILLFSFKGYCQYEKYPFYKYVYIAEYLKLDSNYKEAIKYYKKAFRYDAPDKWQYYYETATCYNKLNKKYITIRYLQKYINSGARLNWITDTNNIKDSYYWKRLVKRYDKMRSNYYKKINIDYLCEISALYGFDQLSRDRYYFSKKIISDTILWSVQAKIDKSVIKKIIILSKKYEWPTVRNVGIEGVSYLDLYTWHHRGNKYDTDTIWKQIKPLINKEIERGNIPPYYFAYFEDTKLIYNEKKQKYGTQTTLKKEGKIVCFEPIENIELVDKYREEVGLEPLYIYSRKQNIKLPDGYIIPDYLKNLDKK